MTFDRVTYEAILERTQQIVADLARPKEITRVSPIPYCRCGNALWFHRTDLKRMPREQGDCDGFVLAEVEFTQQRQVRIPVPEDSSLAGGGST